MLIALDDETTWPSDLLELLKKSERWLPSGQAYVVGLIDNAIKGDEIVAYHCTRLTRDEIERMREEGLCPLTAELLRSRVQRRVDAGDLSGEMAEHLISSGITVDGNYRLGFSCFYFTKEIGDWCWKFFRFWGGESIYVPQLHSDRERAALSSIGLPCIIELAVPVSAVRNQNVAGAVLYQHARRRNIKVQEASHDVAAEPMRVLRVVEYGSVDFNKRTQNIFWFSPIHP